ncbi:putative hydroxyacylglutathione hydrolase [Helianthus anomalus]
MHESLCVTLASLPKPTKVYCGHEKLSLFLLSVVILIQQLVQFDWFLNCSHTRLTSIYGVDSFFFFLVSCDHSFTFKYTVKNLQFAQTVEPENAKISQKLSWAQQQRQSGLPTIPSTIGEELEFNPFIARSSGCAV